MPDGEFIYAHQDAIRSTGCIRTALDVSIRHTTAAARNYDAVVENHAKVFHAIDNGNAERARNRMFLLIDEALGLIETEIAKNP